MKINIGTLWDLKKANTAKENLNENIHNNKVVICFVAIEREPAN